MPRLSRLLSAGVVVLQLGCSSFTQYLAEGVRQSREREGARRTQPTPTPSPDPPPTSRPSTATQTLPTVSPVAPYAVDSHVYRVQVSRVTDDLYRDHLSSVFIETRLCVEPAIWTDALLKWNPTSYKNALVFGSVVSTTCEVVSLHK